ncbi:tyrosine-type recombinase/integrase [Peribacillus frigoritolerans]|uniref:tyrosine-type recombinase/integrase n=1 Tax=Peribacillus frigoritolerans TaxID=450367 RepID=UPI00399D1C98
MLAGNIRKTLSVQYLREVKEITLHSGIPTSLLIETGVGLKEIQQRLGHTDIQTTMNIYAHMTENMEKKASHSKL